MSRRWAAVALGALVLLTAAPALGAPVGVSSATLTTGTLAAPSLYAVAVATNDDRGGGRGRIDAGDSLDLVLDGALDASSVCSSWSPTGSPQTLTGVTLTMLDGASDVLVLSTPAGGCVGGLRLGAVDTGSTATVTGGDVTFVDCSVTLVRTATTSTVTVVFGAASGGKLGKPGTVTLTWTPHPGLRDVGGSPVARGTASVTGVAW